MTDLTMLFDEIGDLLAAEGRGTVAELERTLTDGYAHALSLEAERWRIEKRIGEVASTIGDGDAIGHARELSALATRLEGTEGELSRLRGILGDLRRRTDAVRFAAG